jgi:hypothetical protein
MPLGKIQISYMNEPMPQEFSGNQRRPSTFYRTLPTFIHLFEFFWTPTIMNAIVEETNRYAGEPIPGLRNTHGGPEWEELTVAGLKAFMALALYMGLKKQPNYKIYWMRNILFHCLVISNICTRARFMDLRRCLHITNPAVYENIGRGEPGYDKIRQTRWLVDAIRERCKVAWNLGKNLIIDEMMIRYKGTYSPIRQYLPNKPQKWGLKVWCLACSVSKYVWNFEFYCGKQDPPSQQAPDLVPPIVPPLVPHVPQGESKLAHNVVLRMLEGLWNRGHLVVMDNFFSSIGLFKELLSKGTYACGTMRSNRVGLPTDLKNTNSFKNSPQGTTG